ncbi:unnamed protein product [Cuscuta campestris]|uniref:SnoaL-like domain-containing protein n=1 Tax=Cuscuta campestris TaxID=132261 RepID=A0A484KRT5_9ASTE|nr:unnamed protein product [Cuscuta campestris]
MALSGVAITQQPLWSKGVGNCHCRLLPFPAVKLHGVEKKRLFPTGKGITKKKPLHLVVKSAIGGSYTGSTGSDYESQKIVKELYSSINKKDMKSLETLLSKDCFIDDLSFPMPFQGKKEALGFLEELITSMGQNTEFIIEHVCGGVDQTVAVKWHLEWKKMQIPFTRGCSYYEHSREGEKLVIKKAQVMIESPFKPGGLSLAMLKGTNAVFDAFPGATERFLNSPSAMFEMLVYIYKIVLSPMIRPFISWYVKLMRLTAAFLSLAFKLVQLVMKNFNK